MSDGKKYAVWLVHKECEIWHYGEARTKFDSRFDSKALADARSKQIIDNGYVSMDWAVVVKEE